MEGYKEFNEWLSRWRDMTEQERIDTPIASYEMLACWQAATERAAGIAEREKVGANGNDDPSDRAHDRACDDITAAIRKG